MVRFCKLPGMVIAIDRSTVVRCMGWLVVALGVLLAGCGDEPRGVSQYPMISPDFGEGPWQVVTYQGDKILHETVALDNGHVVVRSESVYINNSSQFVYRDNTPIRAYDGGRLYWNRDGWVINRRLQIVPEDRIFVVNGRPMQPGTPMKLRDYHQPAPLLSFAAADVSE